jgi:hypothetical protein
MIKMRMNQLRRLGNAQSVRDVEKRATRGGPAKVVILAVTSVAREDI